MEDDIIKLEEYKNALENKKQLDEGTKNIDDLSLEELEDVNNLYRNEVDDLIKEYQTLREENKRLKKILEEQKI